jgi:hypothetical protein
MGFSAIGQHATKQRTLVDGTKVKSVNRTWKANLIGWTVWVDGAKYFCNRLSREEAEQYVLAKLGKA